jgi:hypothetical protein
MPVPIHTRPSAVAPPPAETIRPLRRPLTEAALRTWLDAAAPGDAITYHRGALARQLCPQLNLLAPDERVRLARLSSRALKLAEAGHAHLVQRRHGFEDYAYILVVRHRPRRNTPSVRPLVLAEAA